jgi:hypothetical protein
MASSRFRTALALTIVLAFSLSVPFDVLARGGSGYPGGHSSTYSPHSSSSHTVSGSHRSTSRSSIKCESCPRDNRGKIKRDPNGKFEFKRTNPKPLGCDRCEVDHIVPLSKGGRDESSNMQ